MEKKMRNLKRPGNPGGLNGQESLDMENPDGILQQDSPGGEAGGTGETGGAAADGSAGAATDGGRKKEKKPRRTLVSRFDWLNRFKHWYMGGISLFRSFFRVHAAKQTILMVLTALAICFVMAAFYTNAGEFVVKVDREMARDGFYLSEIPNFDERLITLHAVAKEDATNISIYNLSPDLMDIDGVHHGEDYFAYTFYAKNMTGRMLDYRYTLFIRHKTQGIDDASWIMLFHNGKQEIFAKMNANGYPECQYSPYEFPFREYARYPDKQQTTITEKNPGHITQEIIDRQDIQDLDGVFQLNTVPFASAKTICTSLRKNFEDDGMDKFTVVIWLEGEDPECVDRIIGGELELAMSFTY